MILLAYILIVLQCESFLCDVTTGPMAWSFEALQMGSELHVSFLKKETDGRMAAFQIEY